MFPALSVLKKRDAACRSVKYMHTWKNIRGRVYFVQKLYCLDENAVSRQLRAQVLSIGIYIGYDQKKRHSHSQRAQELVIFLIAAARESKIQDRSQQEKVPDHIGDDKIFAKWNLIIHKGMDQMRLCFAALHEHKSNHVKYAVCRNDPDMFRFF